MISCYILATAIYLHLGQWALVWIEWACDISEPRDLPSWMAVAFVGLTWPVWVLAVLCGYGRST